MSAAFRVGYLDEYGAPLAVFLDSAPEAGRGKLMAYAFVGEHCEADIDYLRTLPVAGEAQYGKLHGYLSQRYADGDSDESLRLVIDQKGLPR